MRVVGWVVLLMLAACGKETSSASDGGGATVVDVGAEVPADPYGPWCLMEPHLQCPDEQLGKRCVHVACPGFYYHLECKSDGPFNTWHAENLNTTMCPPKPPLALGPDGCPVRFLDVGSAAVPCTVSGKECVYRDSCPTAAIVLYCATSVLGDGKLYWLQREDACK